MVNKAVADNNWLSFLVDQSMEMPAAPNSHSGYDFDNTQNIGGYGSITSGYYETNGQRKSGYKPFGALGQGANPQMSVSLWNSEFGPEEVDKYMVFTVTNQGNDQANYFGKPDILIEVGSYPFKEIDFTTPSRPSVVGADQAMYALGAVTAIAVNLLALN